MKLTVSPEPASHQRGFSLIEIAIVLFIISLLLGGLLLPLSAQQDIRNQGDTQKQLTEAREALLGFAIANSRLPCPATAASNGLESPVGGVGGCTNPYDGFLPAVTLGFAPIDAQGFAVDGWGGDPINRIRYAITTANASAFTTTNGMKTVTMTALAPDLKVCNAGSGVVNPGNLATADCTAVSSLATDAVAVIYSLGKNAGTGGSSVDEKQNPNPNPAATAADRAFVSAQPSTTFDDQMIWLSKNILFNRMVSAGQLP